MASRVYDYLVIGGGSGGIASARRAASYGAKVAVVEQSRLGGTCVNLGCVPKKVMWNTASIAEAIHESKHYGFDVKFNGFNWSTLKQKRDAYILRLNGIYENNLKKDGIDLIRGTASFVDKNRIKVGNEVYEGKNILIVAGSRAWIPNIPGAKEFGVTSDGFFELEKQPKKVAIVGAGYIAVELAGVFKALGTDVSLYIRQKEVLKSFDNIIREGVMNEYKRQGINVVPFSGITQVDKVDGTLQLSVINKDTLETTQASGYEHLIWAVGREANTDPLNLSVTGVPFKDDGFLKVNEYQETGVPGLYALGDICGVEMLTPVAIAAGRRLADRLFDGKQGSKLEYENIASVIFSHPTAGSVGLSEQAAIKKYGAENIKVYQSKFVNMYYSMMDHKPSTHYKLVCLLPTEQVIGLHLFGKDSDEILQGFAVAVKMGATKKDFDNTVAIHPTAGEELVTMR